MKWLETDELVKAVKVAIDENVSSEALTSLGDIDTLTLDEIIRSKLESGARLVEQEASHRLLGEGDEFATAISWESAPGYGAGSILLPPDFLRLVSFKMSDWSVAVIESIDESDHRYLMQSSRFAGVRGNPERPVVAITNQPVGLVLEFYGCAAGPGAYVSRARYIPHPVLTASGDVERIRVCERLQDAIVYRVASLVAQTIGDTAAGQSLLATSQELSKIETT